jgi:anhydro-N-acetylmuramic acid kinase
LAARGQAHRDWRESIIDPAWLAKPPPKSLDRHAFSMDPIADFAPADGAATLVDVTAYAVARAREHMPEPPRQWFVTGGGRHNPALMTAVAEALAAPVVPVEELGWRGDALEAESFAYLAVRSLRGLPLSLPKTTGARAPVTGGQLFAARHPAGTMRLSR